MKEEEALGLIFLCSKLLFTGSGPARGCENGCREGGCLQLLADVNNVLHPVSLGIAVGSLLLQDRGGQGSLCLGASRGRGPCSRELNQGRC